MLARLHLEICVREAPAFAIMADAAGSDSDFRALMQDMAEQRYQDHHQLAKTLHRDERATPGPACRLSALPTSSGLSRTNGPT